MNLLELPGPEFLRWYAVVAAALAVAVWLGRRWLQRGDAVTSLAHGEELHAYDLALLSGRRQGSVLAAIAALKQNGLVTDTRRIDELKVDDTSLVRASHPLEIAVLDALRERRAKSIVDLIRRVDQPLLEIENRLRNAGLLLEENASIGVRLLSSLPFLALAVMGAVKVNIGMSRDKPVDFLVLLLIATVVATVALALWRPRAAAADRTLEQYREKYRTLRTTVRQRDASLTGDDVATAVGVFGLAGLSSFVVRDPLARAHTGTATDTAHYGCGAASCGGESGGGGGGGGCGGGGCGGGCGGCGS